MEAAQHTDIYQYLRHCPPFDELPDDSLVWVVNRLTASYVSQDNAGQIINYQQPQLYIIRSGHFSLVTDNGDVVLRLAPGDYFGYRSLLGEGPVQNRLHVDQDGLIFVLNQRSFNELCGRHEAIAQYFRHALQQRLVARFLQTQHRDWTQGKVRDVMGPTAITARPSDSIQFGAQLMQQHSVSSLLIMDDESQYLAGIVTDRDLRNRVVAQGLDHQQALANIMTSHPTTITDDRHLFSAMQLMLQHNIHHLPVVNQQGQVQGMVTSTDLLRFSRSDPVQWLSQLNRCQNDEELLVFARQLPHALAQFAKQVADTGLLGQVLSAYSDALTRKLIRFYYQRAGEPPCRYVWLLFGSQAREDQTLHSDQDNGLLFEDLADPIRHQQASQYFLAMAEYVCNMLDQCGIQRCPGNIMASNPEYCLPLRDWQKRFSRWLTTPTPEALLNCKIFFDLRYGEGDAALFKQFWHWLKPQAQQPLFLAMLATDIQQRQVPLGVFSQFKYERDDQDHKYLDLKKRGVAIINDVVRTYALAFAVNEVNTLARLKALTAIWEIDRSNLADLADSWRYLTQLRLQAQFNDSGQALPANCLDPKKLSPLERQHLKEVFSHIKKAQQAAAFKFARSGL